MRKTDIGKANTYMQGGQDEKYQVVDTPFGKLTIPCFVRVPKMRASKRTWAIWHKRFIEQPKRDSAENEAMWREKRLKDRSIGRFHKIIKH